MASRVLWAFDSRLLPETLRALVGNGSVVPSPVYRPVFQIIGHGRRNDASHITLQPVSQNPFRLFLHIDVLILLAINAIICSVYYGVIATISTLLGPAYPFLNETTIGLCFLAAGGGMILGSSIAGRVLDREYRTFKAQEEFKMASNNFGIQVESRNAKDDSFPIEKVKTSIFKPERRFLIGTPGATEVTAIPYCFVSRRMCGIWVVPPKTGQYRRPIDSTDYR